MPQRFPWWMDPWPYAHAAAALVVCGVLMAHDRRRNGRNDHNAWTIAFATLMLAAVVNPAWGVFAERWWVFTLHSLIAGVAAFWGAIKLAERSSGRTTLQVGPGMLGFVAPPSVWVVMIGLSGAAKLVVMLIKSASRIG